MKLMQLLKPWLDANFIDVKNLSTNCINCSILSLHNDSRYVRSGFLFFAYPGFMTDGRFYIREALNNGAEAILYEPENWPTDCPPPDHACSVALPGLTQYLAAIASRFYGEPAKKLQITGITGTNGKTTIAYQLATAHELLSNRSAYIGTLGQGNVSSLQPVMNTTPDALHLQYLLHAYLGKDIKQVCLEVSSHALSQHRVDSIDFDQAIFTNLTQDHLDYHHTMEEYASAKVLLFTVPSLKWGIINSDDPYAYRFKAALNKSCQLITYGLQTSSNSDVRALSWKAMQQGIQIEVDSPWGKHRLVINALGLFNIYNALAVFTSLLCSDYDINHVIDVMAKLYPVPGRMEIVTQNPCVIVDYAHTPDALENVLRTLNSIKKARILVVFGCGGNRDMTKRPIMGAIAARLSDVVIMTSDNPRTEDPGQIIKEIEEGVLANKHPNLLVYNVENREQAIAKAIKLADPDDIILVAGKGHEAYQQIGQVRYIFSDREVIKKYTVHSNPSP